MTHSHSSCINISIMIRSSYAYLRKKYNYILLMMYVVYC